MHYQTKLFNVDSYQKIEIDYSPIYDPAWDLCSESQSTCKSVGEQVKEDTKKTAHQHDRESNHWIEKYWVERGSTKYWYWRYTWMEGRKLKRKYIGSVNSALARYKKVVVEECILDSLSPCEIIEIIDSLNRE